MRHKWSVRFLLAAGAILTVLAVFAVWTDRQALDTEEWVQTSGELLEDEAIKSAVADYLVEELFNNVDVGAALAEQLPLRAKPLAGPAAGLLRTAATEAANKALDTPQLQSAWETANRDAHELLVRLIENEGEFVNTDNGNVTLELRPLAAAVSQRIGIGDGTGERVPESVANLPILDQGQLGTVQTVARLIHGLAFVFTILALLSYALAIYLARGRRGTAILTTGLCLIGAGVAILAIRALAGDEVTNALAATDSVRPQIDATWSIGTSLLTSIATTVIVYGALFVIAAWLGSPNGLAVGVRRALAPNLRDHPAYFYGVLVLAALIYFAAAPTHGLRAVLTLTILTALAILGLLSLRRQAAEEHPDAQHGDTLHRFRDWAGGVVDRRRAIPAGAGGMEDAAEEQRLARLERLGKLREQGLLDDEELAAEKARILAG